MKTITKLFLLTVISPIFFTGCAEVRNSNEVPVDIEIETPPSLSELTAISDPGNDDSPNYTFSSTEVGTIEYGGSCSAGTTTTIVGSNTITLNALSEGTYTDCTIIVTDTFGNVSDTLKLTSFEIDTTPPTVSEVTAVTHPTNDTTPEYTFSSDEPVTVSYGGSCSSTTTSATSGNNTVDLKGASTSTLADNTTFSDCTVTVTDEAGNVGNTITITEFTVDTTASTLEEVTAVTTPTNDTTPSYSFSSSQTGDITYGGSCTSDNSSATASDNNTITLKQSDNTTFDEDTYSDCTLTVTDNASNAVTLNISSFVIDTTAPTLVSISPADSDNVTSVSTSIEAEFSEEMDNISTTTSGTSCSGSVQLSKDSFSSCVEMSSSISTSDNITFTLTPSDNLSFYTTYRIKVTTDATDLAGNSLGSDNTTSNGFTTRFFTSYLGTSSGEEGRGVANDSDNYTFVTGGTYGGLNDNTNLGEEDLFLLKYNSSGTIQWTRQHGTTYSDIGHAIAVYSNSYIYVVGETEGGMDNNTNSGDKDIFIIQYNSSGTRQWTNQLGTSSEDIAYGVAVDSSNNVYVTGTTYGALDNNSNSGSADIFYVKYNSGGIKQWTKQFGTSSEDVAYGITVDSNNVYLTGYTKGDLNGESNFGNSDVFLVKYYDNSTYQWTTLYGASSCTTCAEVGRSVTVDSSNNVYLVGDTNSVVGDYDAFLVKFNSSGTEQWGVEMSSSYAEYAYGVLMNTDGYIYVVGNTGGEIDNNTNSGEQDVFIFKYDSSGNKL